MGKHLDAFDIMRRDEETAGLPVAVSDVGFGEDVLQQTGLTPELLCRMLRVAILGLQERKRGACRLTMHHRSGSELIVYARSQGRRMTIVGTRKDFSEWKMELLCDYLDKQANGGAT